MLRNQNAKRRQEFATRIVLLTRPVAKHRVTLIVDRCSAAWNA